MKIYEIICVILDSAKHKVTNDVSKNADLLAAKLGWFSQTEYPAPYADRKGRIDLFLFHDGKSAGIEVDRKSIKRKSIEKLRLLDLDYKILVIASGDLPEVPEGIDAVVSLLTMDYNIKFRNRGK